MEPKMRKSKRNKETIEERYGLDRLSCLPDCVLTHILSFVDTKSVVRTSVLSKRYSRLWTQSPCLDFKLLDQDKIYSVGSFVEFVKHVLQSREHTNIASFRLSVHKGVCSEFIKECVDYAAEHNVQHLRIRGYVKQKPFELPALLLNSSSLLTLHLHNATTDCIELPKSVSLPNLKILRLKKFEFTDRNFSGELFSGCPSLETLVLKRCFIRPANALKILDVNCSNLRNLEIAHWRSPWKCFDQHMISVYAPKLAVLKFHGHFVKMNFREGLPCLESACIDLCYPTACSMVNANERKLRISESFLSVLRYICNVKALSLSLKTIEVICAIPDLQACAPINFKNLRVLKLTAENKYREKIIRIETVTKLLERIATDVLIFDDSKVKKVFHGSSKSKAMKDASFHRTEDEEKRLS